MDDYKSEYFEYGNENINITSNSSFYLTYKDIETSKAPTKNNINKKIYLYNNKELIEQNIKNLNPEKVAYITFDDGPTENTSEIMNILEQNNVKGTFFFVGSNMEKYEDVVKEADYRGHMIGLHSYSHNYKTLYSTTEGLLEDLEQTQNIYTSITGKETDLLRLPFGSKPTLKRDSVDTLIEEGYKIWDWTLDSNDSNSKGRNKEAIIKTIKNSINNNSNKLVILMHERKQTVESLNEVIKELKESGYVIKPITSHTKMINYWGIEE